MSDSGRHVCTRASVYGVLIGLIVSLGSAEACRVRSEGEGGPGASSHTAARKSLDRACVGRSSGLGKVGSCMTVLTVGVTCHEKKEEEEEEEEEDACNSMQNSAADLEALLIQLELDAPIEFEEPIGRFYGPGELFAELRHPKLDNYTALLPPEGLAFSLRTAYELGDVTWRDSLRTLLLHVARGAHTVPEMARLARKGRSIRTIGGEELTISMEQTQLVFAPRNLTQIPSTSTNNTNVVQVVYVTDRESSCKTGSIVLSISGLLGVAALNLRSVEYYLAARRTIPGSEIIIAAFVVACMLLVVVGGCVYGLLSSRCWVILRLPFSESAGAQNADRDRRQHPTPRASAALAAQKNVPDASSSLVLTPPAVLYRVAAQLWSITHPNATKTPKVSDEKPCEDTSQEAAEASTDEPSPENPEEADSSESGRVEALAMQQQSMEDLNELECHPFRKSVDSDNSKSEADSCGLKHDHACVICMELEGDHVLLPCGHGGYCGECAQRLLSRLPKSRLCPVCRARIGGFAKVSLETPIGAEGDVLETSFGEHVVVNAAPAP